MGFFGNDDKNPSPAAAGKSFVFHRYDGAGHAFMNFNHERYHPAATQHSWGEAMKFLKDLLQV